MDRNSLLRIVIIAGVGLLLYFGYTKFTGSSDKPQAGVLPDEKYLNAPGFSPDVIDPGAPANERPNEGELCTIKGRRFEAVLASRGAGLRNLTLTDPQYAQDL